MSMMKSSWPDWRVRISAETHEEETAIAEAGCRDKKGRERSREGKKKKKKINGQFGVLSSFFFPAYYYIWIGSFVPIAILCLLIFFFPKAETSEFGDAAESIHTPTPSPPSSWSASPRCSWWFLHHVRPSRRGSLLFPMFAVGQWRISLFGLFDSDQVFFSFFFFSFLYFLSLLFQVALLVKPFTWSLELTKGLQ